MRLSRRLLALSGSPDRSGTDRRIVNKGENVSLSGWLSPIFEKYPEYRRSGFLFGVDDDGPIRPEVLLCASLPAYGISLKTFKC